MTLTTLKNDIKTFAKKKYGYVTGFIAKKEAFDRQLADGMIGNKWAEQELEKYKAEGDSYARAEYSRIMNDIDQEQKQELANLKNQELSVTADDVAELTLLASTQVGADELEKYYEKYKNKPLAIKKLNEIAVKQEIFSLVDLESYTAEGAVKELFNFFKQQLAFLDGQLQINGDKIQAVTMDMVVNAEETALDTRLTQYLNR